MEDTVRDKCAAARRARHLRAGRRHRQQELDTFRRYRHTALGGHQGAIHSRRRKADDLS